MIVPVRDGDEPAVTRVDIHAPDLGDTEGRVERFQTVGLERESVDALIVAHEDRVRLGRIGDDALNVGGHSTNVAAEGHGVQWCRQ